MKETEELFKDIEAREPAMMDTWRKLVDRDCGPDNKDGVDAVGKEAAAFLENAGFSVHFHTYERAGNMLVAEYGDMTKPFIILTGHMDTVFMKGTAEERPFHVDGNRVTGPGALDMKGGMILMKSCLDSTDTRNCYGLKIGFPNCIPILLFDKFTAKI